MAATTSPMLRHAAVDDSLAHMLLDIVSSNSTVIPDTGQSSSSSGLSLSDIFKIAAIVGGLCLLIAICLICRFRHYCRHQSVVPMHNSGGNHFYENRTMSMSNPMELNFSFYSSVHHATQTVRHVTNRVVSTRVAPTNHPEMSMHRTSRISHISEEPSDMDSSRHFSQHSVTSPRLTTDDSLR